MARFCAEVKVLLHVRELDLCKSLKSEVGWSGLRAKAIDSLDCVITASPFSQRLHSPHIH